MNCVLITISLFSWIKFADLLGLTCSAFERDHALITPESQVFISLIGNLLLSFFFFSIFFREPWQQLQTKFSFLPPPQPFVLLCQHNNILLCMFTKIWTVFRINTSAAYLITPAHRCTLCHVLGKKMQGIPLCNFLRLYNSLVRLY